jgi:predicted DNA-binding transcriptional regulator
MSEEKLKELREKMGAIQGLERAPSQNMVFFHLLGTGRTMTVREISGELGLTPKATERAVAKLLEKGLIQRAPFRQRSYTCDNKEVLLSLLVNLSELQARLEKRGI